MEQLILCQYNQQTLGREDIFYLHIYASLPTWINLDYDGSTNYSRSLNTITTC